MMFTAQDWKRSLLGCFEISLFMRAGIERFEGTRLSALKSFLIPIVLSPIVLYVMVLMSEGYSISVLLPLHLARMVLSIALFFTAVYFLCKQYKREKYFYRFIEIANWLNIPGIIMVMPIIIALFMGYEMQSLESYAVFITCLGYIYSAFVLTYSLRMPWEMGGFIAIIGLAIDQHLFDLASYIRDIAAIA